MKRVVVLITSVILALSMVICLPASAYVAASDVFLVDNSSFYSSNTYTSSQINQDGLLVITTFYQSAKDPSVLNTPKLIDAMSFSSGTWQGSAVSSLSSNVLYDQDAVGFSQSMSYSNVGSYFVYCLVTAIPVLAGDNFIITMQPSSNVTICGRNQTYFFPLASGLKRSFHSIESTSYTTRSDNQYFLLCYTPDVFPGSQSAMKYGCTSSLSGGLVSEFSNLAFVCEGYNHFFDTFVTPYGLAAGETVSVTLSDSIKDFSFSAYEVFFDGSSFGGDVNLEDSEDSEDSGGSGIDLSGIVSGIKDLPGKIGDAFKTVIDNAFSAFQNFLKDLFMPDTDAIQAEWEFIQSKFQFWLDARDFVQEILNSIKSMQGVPPEAIEFTLTAPDTVWFKGLSGTAVAIDLSWFASYRSSVHVIASAFIWIVYLWKIFHVLPGIISGASGAVSKVSAEKEGD